MAAAPLIARAQPVDVSAKSGIAFWADGAGSGYPLSMFGRDPTADIASRPFVAGAESMEIRIPLAESGDVDPHAVPACLIGRGEPAGAFLIQVDEVRLR